MEPPLAFVYHKKELESSRCLNMVCCFVPLCQVVGSNPCGHFSPFLFVSLVVLSLSIALGKVSIIKKNILKEKSKMGGGVSAKVHGHYFFF